MKSLYGMFLGIMAVSVFVACNAAQPKSQKQATTKQTATAAVKTDPTKAVSAKPITANNKIVVYYFHGNARCPTCYKLETFAKSVVETDFADAIRNGKLEWKTVNVEDKGNEHFTNDYKLYTKSVIVSTQKDGKEASWKNLDQIWTLIGDQTQYMDYIRKEVRACLEGKCL
jgi:hypothetical protein